MKKFLLILKYIIYYIKYDLYWGLICAIYKGC